MITEENNEAVGKSNAEDLLKIALNETQQSIRSYDTKAQICAIGYLFSLNLVLGINTSIFPEQGPDVWIVVFGWGVLIMPMLLFGFVLYPTRKTMRAGVEKAESSIYKVLYIRPERHASAHEITRDALKANALDEIAFELFQSSELRDRKRVRFIRALVTACLALIIMFLIHFGTVFGRMA